MLGWAILFAILAVVAGLLGFLSLAFVESVVYLNGEKLGAWPERRPPSAWRGSLSVRPRSSPLPTARSISVKIRWTCLVRAEQLRP